MQLVRSFVLECGPAIANKGDDCVAVFAATHPASARLFIILTNDARVTNEFVSWLVLIVDYAKMNECLAVCLSVTRGDADASFLLCYFKFSLKILDKR